LVSYKSEKSGTAKEGMFNKLNWHSTRKKTMRLNQKLFHNAKADRKDFKEFHLSEDRVRMVEQVR
jgi:hypothetical protein